MIVPSTIRVTDILLIVLIILIVHYFLKLVLLWRKLPPGPYGLPIVGYIPFMNKSSIYKTIHELKDKYGDIMCLRLGSMYAVFLNKGTIITDAMNRIEFAGRPNTPMFRLIGEGRGKAGIAGGVGQVWQEHRRFSLKHLRDLGFGKTSIEGIIHEQGEVLINEFVKNEGKPIDIGNFLNIAIINIIWKIVAGKQHSQDDERINKSIELIRKIITSSLPRANLVNFFPELDYLPESWFGFDVIRSYKNEIVAFLKLSLDEHKETFDESQPIDFIDYYLLELANLKKQGNSDSTFSEFQLLQTITNLFIAGGETTATMTRWILLYLAAKSDVQEKVYQEIITNEDFNGYPSIADKYKYPYTMAVITEIQRIVDIAPLGFPHATITDINLNGYFIPKNTIIFNNHHQYHRDPEFWEEPEVFKPERFIDKEGKFFIPRPLLTFGTGKRSCVGESIAKMELFIFTVMLVGKLRFYVDTPEGQDVDLDHSPSSTIILLPKAYKLISEVRSNI